MLRKYRRVCGDVENKKLKELRESNKLSQLEIANLVGITGNGYLNYEKGKREPKVRTAIRIAKALGINNFDEFCFLWKEDCNVCPKKCL